MIDSEEFRKRAHELADWMADFLENVENLPVKAQVKPGEILGQLPHEAPVQGEPFEDIMADFQNLILPGMTHWQSPHYHAYFPANSSYPSILAEMLTAALGAQCMIWETSPAAAELEEQMMIWLRQLIGLPSNMEGVIQDTASTGTLVAILTAREQRSNFQINKVGFHGTERYRIYCSTETHSSIEKAVKIAGLGKENLVKLPVDENLAMIPEALKQALERDVEEGFTPLCVIPAIGTTGTVAIDPLAQLVPIAKAYDCWIHVDAAYAGTALILPEYQWMIEGAEDIDSFVFNPHKWMFTNFDCTAYFVRDKEALLKTFEILPEYLKTGTRGKVNDYRDWGIQLGRRFRALKLWFVIRDFGVEGLQQKLRHHLQLTKQFESLLKEHQHFEVVIPPQLNTVCFRFIPDLSLAEEQVNALNEELLKQLNNTGKIYLSHTKVRGKYALRMVIGQTQVEEKHVLEAWQLMQQLAAQLLDTQEI